MKGVLCIGLLLVLASCGSHPTRQDRLKLYNDVLCQLIDDNYYQCCSGFGGNAGRLYESLASGKMDSNTYLRKADSIKAVRKTAFPKCVLDYSTLFQISTKDHNLGADVRLSIRESLDKGFLTEYFQKESTEAIIDTLSQPAQLDARDLAVSYLEIVPYIKRPHRLYGNGMGVIGFSGIFFNEKSDRAILFYEFNCGPKCGRGEIIFLIKKKEGWVITKSRNIWVS